MRESDDGSFKLRGSDALLLLLLLFGGTKASRLSLLTSDGAMSGGGTDSKDVMVASELRD